MPVQAYTAKAVDPAFEEYEPGPFAPVSETVQLLPAKVEEPPMLLDRLPLYRLTIDQYQSMAEYGILDEKSKVHLIDGYLVAKMTKLPPHIEATNNLDYLLNRRLPEGWHLSNQNPIQLSASSSRPEPDVMVLRGRPSDYNGRLATPADVLVLIEVSDSSLRIDQKTMKALYAQSAIPEYWIVNLVDRRIEVYTDPTGPDTSPDYRRRQEFGPGLTIPLRVEGRDVVQILVDEILPLRPEE